MVVNSKKFANYLEHKQYANAQKLTNRTHWSKHFKDVIKPNNLPYRSDPWNSLDGWVSHEHFFGEFYAGNLKADRYLNFEAHKKYCQENNIVNKTDWKKHFKSLIKPKKLKYHGMPWQRFKKEWISDSDFFGDNFAKGKQAKKIKSTIKYEDVVQFLKPFGFKTRTEMLEFIKSNKEKLPTGMNLDPLYQFPDEYNIYDFITAPNKNNFYTEKEAIEVISKLNFKTRSAFDLFNRSIDRDIRIPKDPYKFYGIKASELLGIKIVANQDIVWREFKLARNFIRSKKLKNQSQFYKFTKTKDFPKDIPKNPDGVKQYENDWIDWNDWLGLEKKAYLPFQLAREKARELAKIKGIDTQEKWNAFTSSSEFPKDLPPNPRREYQEFISFPDWLGVINKWDKPIILEFIKSIIPVIPYLEPAALFSIMKNNRLMETINRLDDSAPIKKALDFIFAGNKKEGIDILESTEPEKLFKDIPEFGDEDRVNELLGVDALLDEITPNEDDFTKEANDSLPNISPKDVIETLDKIDQINGISDEETLNFLINLHVNNLWKYVLNKPDHDFEIKEFAKHKGLESVSKVQEVFLGQYNSTININPPNDYSFKIKGELKPPTLMQKLISYRVLNDKRVGNWSGTGAGKTLGAILASRIIKSKLTIIVGLNNTILNEKTGWAGDIYNAFPNSNVLIKEKKNLVFSDSQPNYLLLNYESFQLPSSKALIENILDNHKVDFIVLDEIHSTKQSDNNESRRRKLINYLLEHSLAKNPDLRVLGMSATPVVNNLDEAVSLIEMITGRDYSDLDTSPKISSALTIYEQIVINGIRFIPNYPQQLNEKEISIEDNSIVNDLKQLKKGQILDIEKILLQSKINEILKLIKPGTIVYSFYVEGIFKTLKHAISQKGFKVSTFSGESKDGLDEFVDKRSDVLIGSSALGTGVNGLQYVCNRMIIVTLPWTSAAYEQLVGRIYRQGSEFNSVDIFIPQVSLNHNGDIWSWDKQRINRIHYKKTLADAAVDGTIPDSQLIDRNKMFKEAKEALDKWVSRINNDEFISFQRPKLQIPLPPDIFQKNISKYGEFSLMNQRINTAKSNTTYERFQEDPDEWYQYHTEYRKAREGWNEIPFEIFSERIKKAPDHLVVGDFGCGEAILSKTVRNKVYSFDHVAVDDTVIACDMAHIELPDGILNICVFSLSLMGLNWKDYLIEAHRLSAPGAQLMIAEPQNRWADDKLNTLVAEIKDAGFEMLGEPKIRDKFIYIDASKKI